MKKLYILAAATLALAACDNNEDNPISTQVVARISATIGESSLTRASDTSWDENDEIGITTTFQNKVGPYINMKYTTTNGNGEFSGNTIYIYNPMSVTAYYPFSGTEGIAQETISATTDKQTSEEQPKFDFLFASLDKVDTDKPNVELNFAHKMSKITFDIKKGAGMDDTKKITSFVIEGLKLDGTFNPTTGDCTAKSDADAKELSFHSDDNATDITLPSLIIFPQEVESIKLKIKDNEDQKYVCDLKFKNGIESGNKYSFTITVNKTGLSLEGSNIAPWAPGTNGGEEEDITAGSSD